LLVTSQSPLRIRGERIYPVPPLASNEAVELFTELAAAADPSFAVDDTNRGTIEEVVALLDGMPLALELTAPRIQLFGLEGLRDRLVDRLEIPSASIADLPERHRTLHDAITWSYDLLSDDDQAVLRQLSVFDGGFTLEAAEAVVTPLDAVVAGVASLLDRSLIRHHVQRGEARFSMLESIRMFAVGALEDSGQYDATAQRHGEYFAALAETAMPLLEGAAQQVWMDRLGDEHDNIRAVLRLSRDSDQPDLGLRTAGSIWRFFHRRGHLLEAHDWLDVLLGLPGSSMQARAVGVEGLAGITYWQADYAEAERLYSELVGIYRELGDEKKAADALLSLAGTTQWLGDSDRALQLATEARAAYQTVGDMEGAARVAGLIARNTWQAGHLDEALELWAEARAAYAALGNDGEVRQTDAGIAAVLHQLGRTDEAVILLGEVVEAMVDADDVSGTIMAIDFLAAVAGATNAEPAVRLAGAADSLRAEAGGGLSAESVGLDPARSVASGTMDGTEIDTAWSQGQALTLEEAVVLARKVAAVGVQSN